MLQEKPVVLQAINKSTRSVINRERRSVCMSVCVLVCVCVRGALASSCAFLLEQVFKKRFLVSACKFQNLYVSRLVDLGRSNHISQDKSEQRTT